MADYTLRYTGAQIDDLLGKAGDAAPKNTVYTKAEVDSKLSDKVDAVSGKGLSSNDFTNEEKAKLADLENYDDTDIRTAINSATQSVGNLSSEIIEARGTYSSLDERLDDMGTGGEQVQSDWNETDSTDPAYIRNKPNIPSGVVVDLVYDPTSENAQAGVAVAEAIADKVDKVNGKGLSTNDFTDADKTKLDSIAANAEVNVQSDWNQNDSTADDYIKNKPTITPANDAVLEIQKNGTKIGEFTANASVNSTVNITVPVDADDVSALPDTTKYGAALSLSIDGSTYVVTAALIDQDGETLGTAQTIDLPLESVVVNGSYDDTTSKIVLTLNNGNTIEFSVADLVAGLQSEITSANKLDADLVDDSTSTNKFVTAADKVTWNTKSDFSGSYDDLTDVPEFATVATSGSYTDLTDKPVIPPGVVVDQIYDPTSANAQSGVAVAEALTDKVDKETGKGLSSNDFTNEEKVKIDGLGAASTKGFDSTPTSGNTNSAVSSDGVYQALVPITAELVELVDSGAKNLAPPLDIPARSDLSITNNKGRYTIAGTTTSPFTGYLFSPAQPLQINTDCVLIGAEQLTGIAYLVKYKRSDESNVRYENVGDKKILPAGALIYQIYVQANSGVVVSAKIDLMLCTKSAWDISHKFVLYCPSMAEMYAMIQAQQ